MNLAATSDNLLLLLIFFGLYLVHCVVLLQPAQALATFRLTRRDRGKTRRSAGLGIRARCRGGLDVGLSFSPLRGRTLAFLNPLTPFSLAFKTRPIEDGTTKALSLRQTIA